ncbi:aspartate/glutamate racemase family protein [Hasllibacter sp. MH4015]|uniref:maleate cis-trans isomerase family protein n=1 Tax=Hasllibacter sp. MH4015 TaxID=2854029 RepID=UPI001CD340E3|nr:aspartate/glutamate racemase family protein [Hasllibacter sp. MH4015]
MTRAPYRLTDPLGRTATLGLIVLQSDETIEHDFRRLIPDPDVALYVSRVPSGDTLTPQMIAAMADNLPSAATLLPRAARFDAVAYACTSGTTLIGADKVAALVQSACTTRRVCNPLSAAHAAVAHVGASRLGILSPYTSGIADALADAFRDAGIGVVRTLSFGEAEEANVARIDPASIAEGARMIARQGDVDAIFLSCTNLRTLDIIEGLEAELDMPVFGSNLSLAWHMARMAGVDSIVKGPYRLLRR